MTYPATRLSSACDVADGRPDPGCDAVLAAEEERERLADELHSGLMQSLVVARHALGRESGPPAVKTSLDLPTTAEALSECLAQTRRVVWHLRPRALEHGLPAALEDLAHRLHGDGGASLAVDAPTDLDLSAAQAALAYRVVQAVALASAAGAGLGATVGVRGSDVLVTIVGAPAEVAQAPGVRERVELASAHGVRVELRPA